MVEADTQVGLGNLKIQKGQQNSFINSMKMRKQKELEYYGNLIEEKKFKRGKLPEKYMVNMLFG